MFSTENGGYKKSEVDAKIKAMMAELTALKRANEEKDKLNRGLGVALEKAKQIEKSARNLFNLRMQKVQILYKNFETTVNQIYNIYPQIEELAHLRRSFDKFSEIVYGAKEAQKNQSPATKAVGTDNDTMRRLLDKVGSYPAPAQKTGVIYRNSAQNNISRALNIEAASDDEYESPAEKFLETGETETNAYTKILHHPRPNDLYPEPNESGFDLKEAVNPKDDLEEIMKAFDGIFDETN